MTCPNCHAQIEEGSNFCPYCGYPLKRPEENTEPNPQAAPPAGPGADCPPGASQPPLQQPSGEQNQSSPTLQGAPVPPPRLHRKLSAIEIWLIIVGICALIALIISIVNAVHIEAIKNALIEVIQNLQNASN